MQECRENSQDCWICKDPKYNRIITLSPAEKEFAQRVRLNSETELTVLPAYHDDVITQNSAVGLAFEFRGEKRQAKDCLYRGYGIVSSVDVGEDGEKRLYDENEETPMLDTSEAKALYAVYPETFRTKA